MPLELPKPVTINDVKLKLLCYADPGIGKTTLAGTASQHPDMSPVLIAKIEEGVLSVAGIDGVDAVPIGNSAELEELWWNLYKRKEGWGKYKTIVLDSGTVAANRALIEWARKGRDRKIAKGIDVGDRTIDDIELQDYGKTGAQIRRLFDNFVNLPLHIIVTALRKDVSQKPVKGVNRSDDIMPIIEIRPSFTEKLGNELMGMFDNVWYLYVDAKGVRYMLTQRNGLYLAKTRGQHFPDALGPIVSSPNLADIYNLLLESERTKKG